MTIRPLFSIITITKDNPEGFTKTSDSLKAQLFHDYEWIVIDGNVETDTGIYNAMNKGLERAKGVYVLFLNAGDCLATNETLELVSRQILVRPDDFLYGDVLEGSRYKRARPWKSFVRGMIASHQCMFYRRDALNGLTFNENLKIAGDYEFTCAFLKNAQSVHYMPFVVSVTEAGGISQRQESLGRKEEWAVRRTVLKTNIFSCIMIYCRQIVASFIRKSCPPLFFTIRQEW